MKIPLLECMPCIPIKSGGFCFSRFLHLRAFFNAEHSFFPSPVLRATHAFLFLVYLTTSSSLHYPLRCLCLTRMRCTLSHRASPYDRISPSIRAELLYYTGCYNMPKS